MDSVLSIIFGVAVFTGFLALLMMCAFKKSEVSILSILFGGGYLMGDPDTYFEHDRIPQIRRVAKIGLVVFVVWGILKLGYVLSGQL
tara:strand:- start:51 stop:311 length:261 start_codon:yes stop_codon:yes gene_type:complete